MVKRWEPERAKCKHCGGEIFLTQAGYWVHLENNSIYCEVSPPKAEPEEA